MKRAAALASLSRDHHHALAIAQRLRRATPQTAAEAGQAFLTYWDPHGRLHFRLEDEVLLPALARYADPTSELVARTLCDHVAIRQHANQLAGDPDPPLESLHRLGARLAAHIRMEERALFPMLEQVMPADALTQTAQAMRAYEAETHVRAAPQARMDELLVDLTQPGGEGPVWGMASDDLNATLLSWGPGGAIAEHVNAERDVLLVVVEGSGTLTLDGQTHELRPRHALLVPKGSRRAIEAGVGGLRYLSVHLRRGALQIEPPAVPE